MSANWFLALVFICIYHITAEVELLYHIFFGQCVFSVKYKFMIFCLLFY